jgi:hypothetical protein
MDSLTYSPKIEFTNTYISETYHSSIFKAPDENSFSDKYSLDTTVINLRVREKVFSITMETLIKARGTYLFDLIFKNPSFKDGMVFIDRDDEIFANILKSLKNMKIILPEDKFSKRMTTYEHNYYGITQTHFKRLTEDYLKDGLEIVKKKLNELETCKTYRGIIDAEKEDLSEYLVLIYYTDIENLTPEKIFYTKKLFLDCMPHPNDTRKLKYLQNLMEIKTGKYFRFIDPFFNRAFFETLRKLENLIRLDLSHKSFDNSFLKYLPKSLEWLNISFTDFHCIDGFPKTLKVIVITGTYLDEEMFRMDKEFDNTTIIK